MLIAWSRAGRNGLMRVDVPEDGSSQTAHPKDPDVFDATFARPNLTTFARLDGLGLEVVSQRLEPERAVLACRATAEDRWCGRCGCEGAPRDSVTRPVAHKPFGWRAPTLQVMVPLPVRRLRARLAAGHEHGR